MSHHEDGVRLRHMLGYSRSYDSVNLNIVWQTVIEDIPALVSMLEAITPADK
jgi:uncharacterized protein with HEPN domain